MAIASMTGFARHEAVPDMDPNGGSDAAADVDWLAWAWEAKSVNNRGLDVRCRLPTGFDRLDLEVRRRAQALFSRGSLQIALSFDRPHRARGLRINSDWLDILLRERERLGDSVAAVPPRFETLMAIRGVVEEDEDRDTKDDTSALDSRFLASADAVLAQLADARAEEGARLEANLRSQIDEIDKILATVRALASSQPESIRARLSEMVDALLVDKPSMPADRLAHEVALLAAKADIREEIDRLTGHVTAARDLLDQGGVIGRRLDFLCQEFNREANTICAKAGDLSMTEAGLALKAVIDQMREQVQNVE